MGFALGTETLGSIVSPSTECGTVGLRPTYGRVSRNGAMALSWTMDKIGPICRGVEDCAIVLNAIYGPDGHDRSVGADPFHWEPRKPLRNLKVGVMQTRFDRIGAGRGGGGGGGRGPDPNALAEMKKVYDQALDDLKKAGVNMTPVEYDEGPANHSLPAGSRRRGRLRRHHARWRSAHAAGAAAQRLAE